MTADEIRQDVARTPALFRIAPMFTMIGMAIIVTSLIIGAAIGVTSGDYYESDKATRDAAPAGSGILDDLSFVKTMPLWVLPFTFVGLSSLLMGIALIFATIMGRIRARANAMALTLPSIIAARERAN